MIASPIVRQQPEASQLPAQLTEYLEQLLGGIPVRPLGLSGRNLVFVVTTEEAAQDGGLRERIRHALEGCDEIWDFFDTFSIR